MSNVERVEVETKPLLVEKLPEVLIKDLGPDEVVCPTCEGLGIQSDTQPWGTQETLDEGMGCRYEYQSIRPCRDCSFGVAKKCIHCNTVLLLHQPYCDCPAAVMEREQKEMATTLERWEKAIKISLEKARELYTYLYDDTQDEFVHIDDVLEFVKQAKEQGTNLSEVRLFGTETRTLQFDAQLVLDSECEQQELHDDASDIPENLVDELQRLLDAWAAKVEDVTRTFHPNYEVAVIVE